MADPLNIIKAIERRGGILRVREGRICLTRPEHGLTSEERRLLTEEPEAVIAILTGPEFAFWRHWARDPRPDLADDSALWSLLLMDLYERVGGPPDPLLGALHFLRCLGAQLVEINPWKLDATPADPEGTQGLAYDGEYLGAPPSRRPVPGHPLGRPARAPRPNAAMSESKADPDQTLPHSNIRVGGGEDEPARDGLAYTTASDDHVGSATDQPYIICADGCPYTVIAGEIPLDEWETQWKRLALDALSAARMALGGARV